MAEPPDPQTEYKELLHQYYQNPQDPARLEKLKAFTVKGYSDYAGLVETYNTELHDARENFEDSYSDYWTRLLNLKEQRRLAGADKTSPDNYVLTLPPKWLPPPEPSMDGLTKAERDLVESNRKASEAAQAEAAEKARQKKADELKGKNPLHNDESGVPRYSGIAPGEVMVALSKQNGYEIDAGQTLAGIDPKIIEREAAFYKVIDEDKRELYDASVYKTPEERKKLQDNIAAQETALHDLTRPRDQTRQKQFFDDFIALLKKQSVPVGLVAGMMATENPFGSSWLQSGMGSGGKPGSSAIGDAQIISTTFVNLLRQKPFQTQLLKELDELKQRAQDAEPDRAKKIDQLVGYLNDKVMPMIDDKTSIAQDNTFQALLLDRNMGPIVQALYYKQFLDSLKKIFADYPKLNEQPAFAELVNIIGANAVKEALKGPKGAVLANFLQSPEAHAEGNPILMTGDGTVQGVIEALGNHMAVVAKKSLEKPDSKIGELFKAYSVDPKNFDPQVKPDSFPQPTNSEPKPSPVATKLPEPGPSLTPGAKPTPAPGVKPTPEPTPHETPMPQPTIATTPNPIPSTDVAEIATQNGLGDFAYLFDAAHPNGKLIGKSDTDEKPDSQVPIASLAKLATLNAAFKKLADLKADGKQADPAKIMVTISDEAAKRLYKDELHDGTWHDENLKAGQQYSLLHLMQLAYASSSNKAAAAVAEWTGGYDFDKKQWKDTAGTSPEDIEKDAVATAVKLAKEQDPKLTQLEMHNPNGFPFNDEDRVRREAKSTAQDIAKLAHYLVNAYPDRMRQLTMKQDDKQHYILTASDGQGDEGQGNEYRATSPLNFTSDADSSGKGVLVTSKSGSDRNFKRLLTTVQLPDGRIFEFYHRQSSGPGLSPSQATMMLQAFKASHTDLSQYPELIAKLGRIASGAGETPEPQVAATMPAPTPAPATPSPKPTDDTTAYAPTAAPAPAFPAKVNDPMPDDIKELCGIVGNPAKYGAQLKLALDNPAKVDLIEVGGKIVAIESKDGAIVYAARGRRTKHPYLIDSENFPDLIAKGKEKGIVTYQCLPTPPKAAETPDPGL